MSKKNSPFRVFYRDYNHDVSISSSAPEPLAADRISPLAEKILASEDNFFGVVDGNGLVLQAYLEDEENVALELMFPESQGCFQLICSKDEALKLLSALPSAFSEDMLPGGGYCL